MPSAQPVPLPAGAAAAQVACGGMHTCVLTTGGELLACGFNGLGQLGLGHTNGVRRLTAVPVLAPAKQVECGYEHTCVLTVDGAVLTCGTNAYGQLGLNGVPTGSGEDANVPEPRQIGRAHV